MSCKKKAIPNKLCKYRTLMGFQQKDVAEKLGLTDTAMISRWEQGVSMPSGENLLKLSILYKTLVNELYSELIKEYQQELYNQDNNSP